MQAASSSGDYDVPAEVGVIDFDALADLPPLDEALVPEAMGILGFDMADLSGGATEAPETFAVDATDTRAKKPKIPGGNQREVQKRYRERKKNYTKDLERKVESLETQLKELIGAKQRADEDDVLTLVATGRVVQHDHHPGGPGGYDDDSAYSTVNASRGPGGNGAVGDCPLEHRRVAEAFHAKIANMRALLDAGASDAQLSGALQDTIKFCAPTRAMGTGTGPGNISYQLILNKHAAALNAEAKGAGPVGRTTRGEPGSSAEPERDASSNVERRTCVGSVCGGPLRTVALDGTVMSEDDVASAISAACDSFLTHTPPIETQKLIDWYDEYMRDLRATYFERQKLGLQLAAAGGAIVASTAAIASNTIASNTSGEEKAPSSGSDDSKAPSLFPSEKTASDAVATVTLVAGGAPGAAPSRYGVGANDGSTTAPFANASSAGAEREESGPHARTVSAQTVSAQTPKTPKTPDALAVVELLRESVRREMRMKCEKTAELITRTLSPRTAAHLASAMLPALPDPLAIAAEAKARGFRGTKRWSAVEA